MDLLDTFSDADGTPLEDHTPDAGPPWQVGLGQLTIRGGALQSGTRGNSHCHRGAGGTSYRHRVTFTARGVALGLRVHKNLFRYQDAANYWALYASNQGNLDLVKVASGQVTHLATRPWLVSEGQQFTLEVEVTPASVRCFVDGDEMPGLASADAELADATHVGIGFVRQSDVGEASRCDLQTAEALPAE
jgi:hypothetical protein